MKTAEILELDDLIFVERSFADLADPESALPALSVRPDGGKMLLDEEEDLLAVAFRWGEQWIGANYLCHPPNIAVIDLFEETDGDIYQEEREVWARAVREYYSEAIGREVGPAIEDIPPDRLEKCADLLREIWGRQDGGRCLDCCCGSGIGSAALRSIGMQPLAFDHDQTLLALGLARGRLEPGETACIDATMASAYFRPAPYGAALMLGTIRSFDSTIWEAIVRDLLGLSRRTLITVATREEVDLIGAWCEDEGRSPEVWENERDVIYDRWVCLT
ncbi:MAG: hypothetical protein PWP08_1526 [Methanofollis sp.]|nr:hypothetical protein [Methanofollis sp.]